MKTVRFAAIALITLILVGPASLQAQCNWLTGDPAKTTLPAGCVAGIGITPSSWSLDLNATSNNGFRLSANGGTGLELGNVNSSLNRILSYNRSNGTYQDLVLATATGENQLYLKNSGSVGVGMTPGGWRLDVNGGLRLSNNGASGLELQNVSAGANRIISYNRNNSTYQDLYFGTTGSENTLYLSNSGNAGVGMIPGVFRLDVNGGLRVSNNGASGIELANMSSTLNRMISYNRTSNAYQDLVFGTSTAENSLYLNTAGNAGVGMTSGLTERLNVSGYVKADGYKFSDGSQLLASSGKMGIGTSGITPKTLLHVRDASNSAASAGSPDSTVAMLVERSADGAAAAIAIQGGQKANASGQKGLARVYLGNADEWDSTVIEGGAGHLSFYVRNNGAALSSNPAMTINAAGGVTFDNSVKVQGNIEAKYQDVAEWVPSGQRLAAGTVVIINPRLNNEVMPSSGSYDTSVAGVVSDQPGVLLGEASDTKSKIATTGRVRVHVDATKHPIHAGDLLVTSEKPGVAMASQPIELGGVKLHRPGTLIGKALEPLPGGEGDILVLLSLQ